MTHYPLQIPQLPRDSSDGAHRWSAAYAATRALTGWSPRGFTWARERTRRGAPWCRGDLPELPGHRNPAAIAPVKGAVAWRKASAKRAPHWPRRESSLATGITEEGKREQQEALNGAGTGYVPAPAVPGSPYQLANKG